MPAEQPTATPDARDLRVDSQNAQWRARRRFVIATFTVVCLYVALAELWWWVGLQAFYVGWTAGGDPAKIHAKQASEIAEQSRGREARLTTQHPRAVFQLGFEYGYLSD